MAPQRAFWIIVQGSTPTAFRARRAEDLLPTLHQLQRTQPDTYLRWFDRGRFWESPEAEREAFLAGRRASSSRNREWRPGGAHADPRARFKLTRDEKRARFKTRQRRDGGRGEGSKPGSQAPGDNRRDPNAARQASSSDRPWKPKSGPKPWRPSAGANRRPGQRPWKSDSRPGGKGPGGSRPRPPKGPRGPKGGS
jgi:hypothetical protein